jgi:RNA recognition motif-containing protein
MISDGGSGKETTELAERAQTSDIEVDGNITADSEAMEYLQHQQAAAFAQAQAQAMQHQQQLAMLADGSSAYSGMLHHSQGLANNSAFAQQNYANAYFAAAGQMAMSGAPPSPYLDHQQYAAALASVGAVNGGSASGSVLTTGNGMAHNPGQNVAAFFNASGQLPLSPSQIYGQSPYAHSHAAAAAAMVAAGAIPNGLPGTPFMPMLSHIHPQHHHHQHVQMHHHHNSNALGRTVYVGNLPADASVDELLSQVKFGPIENVRLLPEKSCAFISFLDGNMAAAFHADASVKKMSLHNQELKIGWGKPSPCHTAVLIAVQQQQATRNVYLGNLDENVTEQSLHDDLVRFGPIDQVKIVRDKNIGFVHFLSIATAIKVVNMLPNEPAWAGKRVNYGKDRCAYVPKSQQQNQAHNNQAAAMGMAAAASLGYPTGLNPSTFNGTSASSMAGEEQRSSAAVASVFAPMANTAALQQMGNRTVYLGNIHPDTTTEEICNHIRGGILQSIRFINEKHIAFITFVESNAALAFYHLANYSGIMIHQRRLKIGWGKHSGPLGPAIAMAVQGGGSRNVYIGNIEDFDFHTVEKLRSDFSEYGETELVNTFREKNCAFVNFCNIQNAIKAIEAMKNHPDYKNQRIGAGKDRCGNAPRAIANTLNAATSGLQPQSHNTTMTTGGLSNDSQSSNASLVAADTSMASTNPADQGDIDDSVSSMVNKNGVESGSVPVPTSITPPSAA